MFSRFYCVDTFGAAWELRAVLRQKGSDEQVVGTRYPLDTRDVTMPTYSSAKVGSSQLALAAAVSFISSAIVLNNESAHHSNRFDS